MGESTDRTTEQPKEDLVLGIQQKLILAIKKKRWTQKQVIELCKESGYELTQSELSRLMNMKTSLSVNQMLALSHILGISLDSLAGREAKQAFLRLPEKMLTADPGQDDAFNSFLGRYDTVFMSTDPQNHKILHGEMIFRPQGNVCGVKFRLDTGVRNLQGDRVYKIYNGQMVISKKLSAVYVILYNSQIGELSFIAFRWREFLIKQAKCRIGLCLTVSAGENKTPVAHRIILTREHLKEKEYGSILPFLRLQNSSFLIPKSELENLGKSRPEYREVVERLLSLPAKESYLNISAGILEDYMKKDKAGARSAAECLSAFLEKSETGFHSRLNSTDDRSVFTLLGSQEDVSGQDTSRKKDGDFWGQEVVL